MNQITFVSSNLIMQNFNRLQLLWIRRLSCDQGKQHFLAGPRSCRGSLPLQRNCRYFCLQLDSASFSLVHGRHSYNATFDDNANFLATDFHFIQELGFFQIPEDYGILPGNHFNISKALHSTVVKKAKYDRGYVFCNPVKSPQN